MDQAQIEKAMQALKKELINRFGPNVELRIFGSVARGDYQEHSDVDILVVLPIPVNNAVEEQVFDMAYDVELEYGLVIGSIVYSKDFWYSDRAAAIPLYKNIQRESLFVWMRSWFVIGVEKSRETLEDAHILFQAGRLFSALNRIYYALFYEVIALLLTKDLSSARHTGIRYLFNAHFVKTGKVGVEAGRFFSRMYDFWQKGDYDAFVQFAEVKIKEWLVLAERFINELDQVIEKELNPPLWWSFHGTTHKIESTPKATHK